MHQLLSNSFMPPDRPVSHRQFVLIFLPRRSFVLKARGRVRLNNRKMDRGRYWTSRCVDTDWLESSVIIAVNSSQRYNYNVRINSGPAHPARQNYMFSPALVSRTDDSVTLRPIIIPSSRYPIIPLSHHPVIPSSSHLIK
ncbi:hypothetical protein [Phaffia rhodozyma]|uniref:Uncharacterized protein n=1 Tax=Phaffia rhodozyma TaxID=264483 RepID=A0A0F7SII5_PHARH|nr:hypothetical protein [Phaffia rhodozyma]